MATQQDYGTGRRKSSAARVFLRKGSGSITVNGKALDEFFGQDGFVAKILPDLSNTATGTWCTLRSPAPVPTQSMIWL